MPEAPIKQVEFEFPYLGVHEDCAISEQPRDTTPYALNVRGYDLSSRRDVGCQRIGTAVVAHAVQNSTTSIDAIASGFFPAYGNTEQICYLQNKHAYVGDIALGQTLITESGTASSYTNGSNSTYDVDVCCAYGAFWVADGVWPIRKILPSNPLSFPAATAGSLPAAATILALYRGRLFHSGIYADPYNYFASRSGDPLDYDYAALDQAGAFAGNNTAQAGLIGDRITALIPFSDMAMVMGMAGSLAVMRGDPKAGGNIAFLSREVGIASKNAWARSPDGTLYFMAWDGLYRLKPDSSNSPPQPMSRGRLDRTLGHIDYTTTKVLMAWDPLEQGLKIVLVPASPSSAVTVVFWEQRKNAFWVDSYPAGKGPTALAYVHGAGGLMLLGGYDGWLRQSCATANTDDGSTIISTVCYPPVMPFGNQVRAKVMTLRHLWGDPAYNGTNNFHANWALITADDPVDAFSGILPVANFSAAAMTGSVTLGGYKSLLRSRARGACLMLEIGNATPNKTWQVERITAAVAPSGRVRT